MRAGRPVLLDLRGDLDAYDDGWIGDGWIDDGWIDVVRARCDEPPADTLLIRPDGYVAWADADGLAEAARDVVRPAHNQPGLTSPDS